MAFGTPTRLKEKATLIALMALFLLAQSTQSRLSKHDAFIDEFGPLFDPISYSHKGAKNNRNSRNLQTGQTISVQVINGVATNDDYPPCTDNVTRVCNEAANSIGPGVCGRDSECFNGRVCNTTGFCVGSVSYKVVVTAVTSQKQKPVVEQPKTINQTSTVDKEAILQQQMDAYIASLGSGNSNLSQFDNEPAYFNDTLASEYINNLNSSISAELAAYQKNNPVSTVSPKTITQNVTVNKTITQSNTSNKTITPNVTANKTVVTTAINDANQTRPSSLFTNPYATDDYDAQPGETTGYIQVLKSMQVNGVNVTTTVTNKTVQTSTVKAVNSEIDSLPKFFGSLPQSPNFEKATIFSSQNPLKNVTSFIDSQGIYSTAINASAIVNLNANSQSQVLYNPEVNLDGYHPPEESQAYLQVLNSMHVEPTAVSSIGHNGLNKALVKLLSYGDRFMGEAQKTVGSNGVLINDLVQNIAKLAFTSSAAPLRSEISEIQSLAQRRLQMFLDAYLDHVAHESNSRTLSGERLERAVNFERRLNCIVDADCDFRQLANNPAIVAQPKSIWGNIKSFFHRDSPVNSTSYSDNDPLIQFLQEAAKQMPGLNPDSQIKSNTLPFIEQAHEVLTKEGAQFPELNAKFQVRLANLKSNLPTYQSLTQDQFKTLLSGWNEDVKAQIDAEFTKERLSQRAVYLTSLKAKINDLESLLGNSTPKDTVLVADLELLKSNIQAQIDAFQGAQTATEDQMAAARAYLKDDFLQNLRNVDVPKSTELIHSIANKTAAVLRSDFGKSINFDNLNFIVSKSIASAHSDFDQMKSSEKESGFMLNNSDLDILAKNIQDEFQKGRTSKTQSYIDLSDFKAEVERLNKELAWRPSNSDKAHNAADIFIMYENAVYDYLGSDQFYANIRDYVGKYYNIYRGHAAMLTPFFQLSNVYKTLTAGLDNPNALGNANPTVARALRVSTAKVIEQQHKLSAFDRKVFSIIHHSLAELADNSQVESLSHKLENVLSTLSSVKTDSNHYCFCQYQSQKDQVPQLPINFGRVLGDLSEMSANSRELEAVAQQSSESGCRLERELKVVDFKFTDNRASSLTDRLLGRRKLQEEKRGLRKSQLWSETAAHLRSAELESHLMTKSLEEAERELASLLAAF